jgi:hypothetical protein
VDRLVAVLFGDGEAYDLLHYLRAVPPTRARTLRDKFGDDLEKYAMERAESLSTTGFGHFVSEIRFEQHGRIICEYLLVALDSFFYFGAVVDLGSLILGRRRPSFCSCRW